MKLRNDYPVFVPITLRWQDNDQYGHVNNVVYYSFFDTAVNQYLIKGGVLHPSQSPVIGLVVQTHCEFTAPLSFPGHVDVGLRVGKIGRSSVRYELGIFAAGQVQAAAFGHFIHVYVDSQTRRPVDLPLSLKQLITPLLAESSD